MAKRKPSKIAGSKTNLHFNRQELATSHLYITKLGGTHQKTVTSGFVKCKLAHGQGFSIIVPDQIYLGKDAKQWVQPLSFLPNRLAQLDTEIKCSILVDISCGQTVELQFSNANYIRSLADGSELYRCQIVGPSNILAYSTGTSELIDNIPYINLYHHTNQTARDMILASNHFRISAWHIQGTSKKLKNIGYAYFTCLDVIKQSEDLHQIGMAHDGKIHLLVDDFEPPEILLPNWEEDYKDSVLALEVYRESTTGRQYPIKMLINAALLAPQHIYRHAPASKAVYYQPCAPFIYRIGMLPGNVLSFNGGTISGDGQEMLMKYLDYAVIGDATTLEGLKAPYDEEDTTHIAKIQRVPSGSNILKFWFDKGNQDLFTPINTELQDFEAK